MISPLAAFGANSILNFANRSLRNLARIIALALGSFRKGQDVSCRNLKIYLSSVCKKIPAKVIAEKFKISEDNVYVIKFRVGKILEKHGKKYFQAALKKAA